VLERNVEQGLFSVGVKRGVGHETSIVVVARLQSFVTKVAVHVQNIWNLFNLVMNQINNSQECVLLYENVFKTCDIAAICLVKMRVIQALIQIERPVHWNRSNIVDIIKDLINTEKYNACMSKSIIKFKTKWNILDNIQ
jgi:hypothetical protein